MSLAAFGFLMFLCAAGLAVNFALFRRIDPWFLGLSATFSGAVLWVTVAATLFALSSVVTGNTNLFSPATTLATCGAIIVVLWGRIILRVPSRKEWAAIAAAGLFAAVCAAASIGFDLSVYTFDSYDMYRLSYSMAEFPSLHGYVYGWLVSYPFLLPTLTFVSGSIGVEHAYFVPAFFSANFVGVFVYCSFRAARNSSSRSFAVVTALTVSWALFSTYFMVFNFFYMNSHMLAAAYIYLFAYAGWMALETREENYLRLAGLLLVGYVFARLEAPLIAAVFAFVLATLCTGRLRGARWLTLPLVVALLWYLTLWQVVGEAASILSAPRFLQISGIMAVAAIAVAATEVRRLGPALRPLPIIAGILSPAVVGVLFLVKPEHMRTSAGAMIDNFLETGLWTNFPTIILILGALLIVTRNVRHEQLFLLIVIFYIGELLLFGFLRSNPYRLGFGDSANRMLLHIAPVVMLWIVLKIVSMVRFQSQGAHRTGTPDPRVRRETTEPHDIVV